MEVLPLALGLLSSSTVSKTSTKAWYGSLRKPTWSPPSWVFGPVWTALYLAMGIALSRVRASKPALSLFALQMTLNILWTPVFFGLKDPAAALLVIGILLGTLLPTTYTFWRIDRMAGYLIVPYVIWTLFASVLNLRIVTLN